MEESLHIAFSQAITSQNQAVYRNVQLLGRGGNAEVYLVAASSGPHRGLLFALKVFYRLSRPEWQQSFLQEIAFLRECNHPAVMRVFNEGIYLDQYPFVVAEYLPETLESVLRRKVSTPEKLSYAVQLLSALEYLAGPTVSVVHRDIKPGNIFLKGSSCVLGDFSLVKRFDPAAAADADREALQASQGPGMPRFYRTPDLVEYLKGGPLPTPKSDVYQLGLVLAELFTGKNPQRPLRGGDFTKKVKLDPLGPIAGQIGEPIGGLLERMLTAIPEDRPAAADLLGWWQELFLRGCKQKFDLEGWVF